MKQCPSCGGICGGGNGKPCQRVTRGAGQEVKELKAENDKLIKALKEINNVMGEPCKENTCAGCCWEMSKVLRITKQALDGNS